MKSLTGMGMVVCLVVCLMSPAAGWAGKISPQEVAGKPDPPMKVVREPNPLLLGHWGCTHITTVSKTGEKFEEPVEFWLVEKDGGHYGLYFFRDKQRKTKTYRGWREWTLNGDRIVTEVGVSIFVKDGEVYYEWKNDPPTRMTRLEDGSAKSGESPAAPGRTP